MRIFTFFIMQLLATVISAQTLGTGLITAPDGKTIADVAIVMKDRPTYISGLDGQFKFALSDGEFTVEKIEKDGYELLSPKLPYTSKYSGAPLKVVMKRTESSEQQALQAYGDQLYRQALALEQQRLYRDAADSLVKRAALDSLQVRWIYETGEYMHKYGDFRSAQAYYNKAIHIAKERYGDKNQYLAICYELYGENYFDWRMWGEESNLNYADAKTYYQYAGHFWYSLYGEYNNELAQIYLKMGLCWLKLDNLPSAKKFWDKALETLQNTEKPDQNLFFSVYLKMVEYFYSERNYTETMAYLQKLLSLEKEMHGDSSEAYQTILEQIDMLKKEMEQSMTQNYNFLNELDKGMDQNEDFEKGVNLAFGQNKYEEAIPFFQKAADTGLPIAIFALGYCYYELNDYQKAIPLFNDAAEKGESSAQLELANCYYMGKGVAKDTNKAFTWYTKAAENGHNKAQLAVGIIYNDGKDNLNAVHWLTLSDEQGNANAIQLLPEAQYNLGTSYYYGDGVSKDLQQALLWHTKAAEQGYAAAQSFLGVCYLNGDGVDRDPQKAIQWLTKAAEQGYVKAQYNLATCYYSGTGVTKNLQKAALWMTKAAEQGHDRAQYNIGAFYCNGEGVARDLQKARQWMEKAAANGNANAKKWLQDNR